MMYEGVGVTDSNVYNLILSISLEENITVSLASLAEVWNITIK